MDPIDAPDAAVPAALAAVVRFGEFEANLHSGELHRAGLRIRLPDQSFRVLALLLESAGHLVTRADLRDELWARHRLVDFDGGLNSAVKRLRDALHDTAERPRFIETLPRRGYRFRIPVRRVADGAAAAAPIRSVAVLPMENLTGDPALGFLVDGMTDTLISRMTQISALRVISRTSVTKYKGARELLPDIARRLKVDAVVEGAVARAGSRIRVTAQLIHAPTDRHLWAGEYERDLTDVLEVEAQVAQAIVDAIRVKLAPREEAGLGDGPLP